jgi:hypothetical protein
MAILVVPGVIIVSVVGKYAGRPWASVWGMTNAPDTGIGAPIPDIVRDFANNWQDHITPVQANAVTIDEFRYLSIDSASGSTGSIAPDPNKPVAGTSTDPAAPPNVTYLIRKHTDSGRGKRAGRCYLPGVTEGHVAPDGTISNAARTAIATAFQNFLDGVSDEGGGAGLTDRWPCVIHRPAAARVSGQQVVSGSISRITSITVDGIAASQRRRLRG